MKTFEVSFKYGYSDFVAVVRRNETDPDVVSIKEPNCLNVPDTFVLSHPEEESNSVLRHYPGLARRIYEAIERYCNVHSQVN